MSSLLGFSSTLPSNKSSQEYERATLTLRPHANAVRRASVTVPDFEDLQADSKYATDHERTMPLKQALILYKKAIGWSMLLSTAIIMEGYDGVLLGGFYALPAFREKYGDTIDSNSGKQISAPWRAGLSNAAIVGEILGLMVTGIAQDRYGYKKTIACALALLSGFIFISFFSVNLGMLLAGQLLCGLCWGTFQTITTSYASEVTPVVLRPYLTTYVNLCWVLGQLLGSGVLRAVVDRKDDWAYKIPFGIQWVWPIPILLGSILAPESPWWLVRKERYDDAKRSLLRLTSQTDRTFDADKTIAMMRHTTELEKQMLVGTSYLDCFRGTNLRRTEIVCITWLVQTVCGNTFMTYSTVFYEQAGLSTSSAFNLTIGQYCLGVVGTFGSWFLLGLLGRRTIYLGGACTLTVLLFTIGFLGTAQSNSSVKWAIGSMLIAFTFVYDLTIGPVCYSLVSELSSTRLKAKTIVVARNLFNIGSIVANIITNYQLTDSAWNWGAYAGFFWGGSCLITIIWIFFRLPEPKHRTYAEINILFEHFVPARKFKSTDVSIYYDTIVHLSEEGGKEKSMDGHERAREIL